MAASDKNIETCMQRQDCQIFETLAIIKIFINFVTYNYYLWLKTKLFTSRKPACLYKPAPLTETTEFIQKVACTQIIYI